MTTTNKNPLTDKKWLKEFAEGFQKDVNQSFQKKTTSSGWVGEINCTQADVGEPNYPKKRRKR